VGDFLTASRGGLGDRCNATFAGFSLVLPKPTAYVTITSFVTLTHGFWRKNHPAGHGASTLAKKDVYPVAL
jgi:hypothetical protein